MLRLIERSCFYVLLILVVCITMLFRSCEGNTPNYYVQRENYISVKGVVYYVTYSDDNTKVYFGISNSTHPLSSSYYVILSSNLQVARNNGFDEKVKVGSEVVLTVPANYYEGHTLPVAALVVNGETLLDFEEGFQNMQQFYANQ